MGKVHFQMNCFREYVCPLGHRQEKEFGMMEFKPAEIPCPCGKLAVESGAPKRIRNRTMQSYEERAYEREQSIREHGKDHWKMGLDHKYCSNDNSWKAEDFFGK